MTPEMEAAAFDGLANNPTAQRYAEGRADEETRAALLKSRDAALIADRSNAGLLAFIVRDLMDAAAYPYTPDRSLAEQARECCQLIRQTADQLGRLEDTYARFGESHDAQVQQLTDLVKELRKHLQDRALEAETLTRELSADLTAERQRTADLDQLLQARDTFLEAARIADLPSAAAHEHLTGGYALTKDTPA